MPSPSIVFPSFFLVLGLLLFFLNLQVLRKGAASQRTWKKTNGTVEEFGLKNSLPRIRYRYHLEGREYEGANFGAVLSGKKQFRDQVSVSKKTYRDERGRLRFPPGRPVTVYYDPRNPGDALLVPGTQPGTAWMMLISLIIVAGAAVVLSGVDLTHLRTFIPWRGEQIFAGVFLAAGGLCAIVGLRTLLKHLGTRDWSHTEARIRHAEVIESRGQKNNIVHTLDLLYDYEVDGTRYTAGQIYALGSTSHSNRERMESEAAAYRADPCIRIWYNPTAPWECYLRQGPLIAFFIPGILSIVFLAVGAVLVTR